MYLEGSSSAESSKGLANAGGVKVGSQVENQWLRMENHRGVYKQTAARLQAQVWETKSDHTTSSNNETPKKNVFRINRNTMNGKPDSSIQAIIVKGFEEIMQEKRLSKQQEMLTTHNSKKSTPPHTSLEKSTVIRPRITTPAATPLPTESSNRAKPSVRQCLGLKPQATFPVPGVRPQKRSSVKQAKDISLSPRHRKLKLSEDTTVKVREVAAPQNLHSQDPQRVKTREAYKTTPSKAVKLKVEPRLSVNLPMQKPAAQKKRCLRREALCSHCFAIGLEPPCKCIRLFAPVCSSEFGASTQQPSSLTEDVLSLPRNPLFSAPEPFSGLQSPVTEPPIRPGVHQSGVASALATALVGTSSPVDDLDALLDEFIDDDLEDEMDLNKSVDGLLVELWKLINSSD